MSDTLNAETVQTQNATPIAETSSKSADKPSDPCCTVPPGGDPGPGR
jgi:hypothetical protein